MSGYCVWKILPYVLRSTLLTLSLALNVVATELTVRTDFEGGSARVESIDPESRTIRFSPAGDPLRGWPCWWYLRIDGAQVGQKVTFELAASPAIADQGPTKGKRLAASWAMADRATVSFDGVHWLHTEPGQRRADTMRYEVTPSTSTFWLAWGPPFTHSDSQTLVAQLDHSHAFAVAAELGTSREGRPLPAIVVQDGKQDSNERFGVWIQARQHAWESGSSWVAKGFAEWLVGDDAEALWLRQQAEIVIVPVMDVDHVATGDGGKEATPQDHNRDWSQSPHWPEVAAVQKRLKEWAAAGRLDVFVDLHNPGPSDRKAFFYVGPEELLPPKARRNRSRFIETARAQIRGPIQLAEQTKPSGPGYHPLWRQISGHWVAANGNLHTMSICLETAWNTPDSVAQNYLVVGQQLGKSIAAYLRQQPRAD